MPYLKLTSVASFDALLGEIRDFLNATGDWTIHEDLITPDEVSAAGGRQFRATNGDCLVGLRSTATGAGANILYLFDGIPPNAGGTLDTMANNSGLRYSGTSANNANGDTGLRQMQQHAGPFPTAHLFSNDPSTYCYVATEVTAGVYKHLVFGNLTKYWAFTGGGFYGCTNWATGSIIDQPGSSSHSVPFDNNQLTVSSRTTVHYEFGADKWLAPGNDTVLNTVQRRKMLSTFRGGFGRPYVNKAETPYSGLIALQPVLVGAVRQSDTPDTLRRIGVVPDMAALNIQNLAPGAEYTLGGDTWVVFPLVAKNGGSGQYNSGTFGVAYKKHA